MCAIAAFVAVTIALTWPLLPRLGAVVPKDLGDPLFSTWALWWNARVVPFSAEWWDAPIFAPAGDAMALADPRLGLSLLTTPLIHAGVAPLAAYGAAFLVTFVGSAAAVYALCRTLGVSRGAAFVGGLAFGVHPFRAAHLEHLELLALYWLPITLACLHAWRRSGRNTWLAGAAATLLLQGLTTGYYLPYGLVLIGAWTVWFGRHRPLTDLGRLLLAAATPVAVLWPVWWHVRSVHRHLGLARTITDTETLSADLLGFLTPPEMLAFWNGAPWTTMPETALFPGLTAAGVVLGAWWLSAAPQSRPLAWERVARWSALAAVVPAALGAIAATSGAFAIGPDWLRLSVSNLYKPLSVALACLLPWLLTRARLRHAWATASPLAFYALATAGLWVLALGPTVRLGGERVLYKAPYAWLMAMPGVGDTLRAPARFAMLAALTLAVAAALSLDRVRGRLSRRAAGGLCAAVVIGVLADGWIDPLPLPAPPPARAAIDQAPPEVVVLELPLGVFADTAAMYRAITHGRRLANGYSGYRPPHYQVLAAALDDGDTSVLEVLAGDTGLVVTFDGTPEGRRLGDLVSREFADVGGRSTAGHDLVRVPPRSRPAPSRAGSAWPIVAVTASAGHATLAQLRDGDLRTAWTSAGPQAGGESVVVDLGEVRSIVGVQLSLGPYAFAYPRHLTVATSTDGVTWRDDWAGRPATAVLGAALDVPAAVPLRIAVSATAARYVRMTAGAAAPHPWAIAELAVLRPAPVR